MSSLWRVHLNHFLRTTKESTPVHTISEMTAPPTPVPTPQTMGLGLLNAAFDGIGRIRWLVRSAFDSVGRTRWSALDGVGRTRWVGRSTINRLSGGLEMLAVAIDVNVLSGNCVVGLIRCVEVASN